MNFETIIFAAGLGTRLGEIGKYLPKVLLPVWVDNNKLEPILIRIIRQAIKAKTSKVYIVTHYYQEYIVNFVKANHNNFEIPIEFIYQKELNGEAGGVFEIPNISCPLLAIDGDNYLTNDLFFLELVDCFFQNSGYMAAIGVMEVPDIHRYANVKISDNNRLLDIIEKPLEGMQFGNIAKMGCYVLSEELIGKGKAFFNDSNGDLATTAAFSNLCKSNENVICVNYSGGYIDIGTLDSYMSHLTTLYKSK